MWKPAICGIQWLVLLIGLQLLQGTRGGPCCKDGGDIYYEEKVKCVNTGENIELYKYCSALFAMDESMPHDKNFAEDENKEHYTLDNKTWDEDYCSGIMVNKSDPSYRLNHTFLCFKEEDDPENPSTIYTLYAYCQLLSTIFIISTMIVYLMLPELRDLQGKCVMCFIGSLALGYMSLSYLQLPVSRPTSQFTCLLFSFFTYFWLLASFFWLNVNSFNMWRSAVLGHIQIREKKLFIWYILAGWGLPLIFLAVAITTHNLPGDLIRPNFAVDKCWFYGSVELWSYFYGPVLILLICNVIYFLSTAWHLWSDYRSPTPINRIKSLRVKFGLYLKLFLTMGITWIFEIVSFVSGTNFVWKIMDIMNCLQGVIIFIVMIATRRRVWRALARRKPCGLTCNKHWETMEDDETENALIVDEQQLETEKA